MRRKAFTLIELVIVMAIIGILSTMFIMSAAESQRSADVTNILNNLQNLRLAALSYYADNVGKTFDRNLTSKVKEYTNNWDSVRNGNLYYVINDTSSKKWWAAYWTQEPAEFKKKIQARATSMSLKGTTNSLDSGSNPEASPGSFTSDHKFVLLLIRSGNR